MKIVCDNCATKYSIADEKVRGKVFKIRCKKCSHIIVVRGSSGAVVDAGSMEAVPRDDSRELGADEGFGAAESRTVAAPDSTLPPDVGEGGWHLVIDREQVGPMTADDVRAKFAAGEVDVETYAWREGFGDWLRLGSIDEFAHLAGGAADMGSGGGSTDLFAPSHAPADDGGRESPDLFANAAANTGPAFASPATASADDLFGGQGGGLFSAPEAAPARERRSSSGGFAAVSANGANGAMGDGALASSESPQMTGQRNENSVLFSLNNLQSLATGSSSKPAGAAEPRAGFATAQGEGSGLIDIRAMAASTLAAAPSSARADDIPGLSSAPVFSSMAAPILMPAPSSGPPKWIWAVVGVGALAVIAMIWVGALLLRKPMPAQVAMNTPVAAPAVAAATGTPAAAVKPATAPVAAPPVAPATAPVAAQTARAPEEHRGHRHERSAKAEHAAAARSEHASAPVAVAAAPAQHKKHDALDELLDSASPDTAAPSHHASSAAADSNLPDELGKDQIVAGMRHIKPRVFACFEQYKVPGVATVAMTINRNGRVSNAHVVGSFSGTPTGACVARAAHSASFPRFKGSPQSIDYPFVLR